MIPGARLVILGRQGAGKGTQCGRLARHYVVPHISTGDIFRSAVKEGTEFGRQASKYMNAGKLIPDEVVIGVVKERLDQADTKARGFVLDGFPRTVHQGDALADLLANMHLDLHLVLDLDVPEDVVLRRLAARRVCSTCNTNYSVDAPPKYDWTCDNCGGEVVQRTDDTEEAIRQRLADYDEATSPLIDWYRDRALLEVVDGLGPQDEVTQRLVTVIDARRLAVGR